jgi:hypothetical protein
LATEHLKGADLRSVREMRVTEPSSIGLLAASVLVISIGVLFRAGRLRAWAATYRNPLFPAYMRNAVFAAIPSGTMFLLWWILLVVGNPVLKIGLFAASLILAGLASFIAFRAPGWSRPAWLRTNEPKTAVPESDVRLGRLAYVGLWVVFAAAVCSWWVFDLSLLALSVSLAFIVPVIAAYHRRKPFQRPVISDERGSHGPARRQSRSA